MRQIALVVFSMFVLSLAQTNTTLASLESPWKFVIPTTTVNPSLQDVQFNNFEISTEIVTIIVRENGEDIELDPAKTTSQETTSREITFHLQHSAVTSPAQFKTFQCRIFDDSSIKPSFQDCSTPKKYTDLSTGQKTFEARAITTVDNRDIEGPIVSFTWKIVSILEEPRDITPIPPPETAENLNDLGQRKSELGSQLLNDLTEADQNQDANTIANQNNPPFRGCIGEDLAVYNIEGEANMERLIGSSAGLTPSGSDKKDVPIAVILFSDINPTDYKNIILNNNQPYIKGELVVFPGEPNKQNSVDFEVKKISTDCKTNAIRKTIEEVGSPENVNSPDGGAGAAINQQRKFLNPPFGVCTVSSNNPSADLTNDIPTEEVSDIAQDITETQTLSNDLAEQFNLTNREELAIKQQQDLERSQLALDLEDATENAAAGAGKTQTPGQNTDVAKYVIAGKMDVQNVQFGDRQNVVVRVYNVLDPLKSPEFQTVSSKNSNNLQLAVKIEVDPGDSDWTIFFLDLLEISTSCLQIPFVSSPRVIGESGADFSAGPMTS